MNSPEFIYVCNCFEEGWDGKDAHLATPRMWTFRSLTFHSTPHLVFYLSPEGRSPRVGTPLGGIKENGTSWGPLSDSVEN